jgi:hypothetical protein
MDSPPPDMKGPFVLSLSTVAMGEEEQQEGDERPSYTDTLIDLVRRQHLGEQGRANASHRHAFWDTQVR